MLRSQTAPAPTRAMHKHAGPRRRDVVLSSLATALLTIMPDPPSSAAADALPPSPGEPACAACVGYVDGTLGSCSAVEGPCSSSYDDRPAHFVAPWAYDGPPEAALRQLLGVLRDAGAEVQQQTADYVYAVLPGQGGPAAPGIDLEFVFARNDNTVALRAAQQQQPPAGGAAGSSSPSSGAGVLLQAQQQQAIAIAGLLAQFSGRTQPASVLEELRLSLGWEVVPILRNRQRLFLFGESPWDSFGPVPPPVPDYARDL